jgi:multidrug efflux system membrane fusion protein
LAEDRALLRQRQVELEAALKLAKKGFRAETQLAGARARYDQAQARLQSMKIDFDNTTIVAPFDGVLEDRMVEIGDFVEIGDPVGVLVDLDPVLVVGHVNERHIGWITVGGTGSVAFLDGRQSVGTVRFVSSVANADTRTFRVELTIANPERRIKEGLTAELTLPTERISAHLISPAILTLADDGRLGVRGIVAGNKVQFYPVRVVANTMDGTWVDGLPDRIDLIVVGQEFVADGDVVEPVAVAQGAAS